MSRARKQIAFAPSPEQWRMLAEIARQHPQLTMTTVARLAMDHGLKAKLLQLTSAELPAAEVEASQESDDLQSELDHFWAAQ